MKGWLFRSPCDQPRQRPAHRRHSPSPTRGLRFELLEDRCLLTTDTWALSGSGNWNTAANWSTHAVPTSTSAVVINTDGCGDDHDQRRGIGPKRSEIMGSQDTLSITGGSLTTSANLSNSGTITVAPYITVTAGSFTQTSTGTLDSQLGGAPSSGAFGRRQRDRRGDAGRHAQSRPRFRLYALDHRQLHPPRVRQRIGHVFELFASQRLDLPVRRRRHVYQRRGQRRSDVTAVTSTINANAAAGAVATQLFGGQPGYWDDQQTTTQTQQMVTAAGLAACIAFPADRHPTTFISTSPTTMATAPPTRFRSSPSSSRPSAAPAW